MTDTPKHLKLPSGLTPEKHERLVAFDGEAQAREAQLKAEGRFEPNKAPPEYVPPALQPGQQQIGQPVLENAHPIPPYSLLAGEPLNLCLQIAFTIANASKQANLLAEPISPQIAAQDLATIHLQAPIDLLKLYKAGTMEQLSVYQSMVQHLDRTRYTFTGSVPAQFKLKRAPQWQPGNLGLSPTRKAAQALAKIFRR